MLGLTAGFFSGIFGVGGGTLIVPALVLLGGFSQRRAHGTSLAAVLPIAAAGVVGFAVEDSIDWAVAAPIALGAVAGAPIGARYLQRLSARTIALAFVAFLLASAARLFMEDAPRATGADLTVATVVALLAFGVVCGVLAGLLGVGGGIIMVPVMVTILGLTPALAKGTSLAIIIPTSASGTWRNLRNKNADLQVAMVIGLTGLATAYLGSMVSVRLDPEVANVTFALLLVTVAARMLLDLRRKGAR